MVVLKIFVGLCVWEDLQILGVIRPLHIPRAILTYLAMRALTHVIPIGGVQDLVTQHLQDMGRYLNCAAVELIFKVKKWK
jgi:hypothetical protein